VNYGWRREIIGDNAPDSFHILCYVSGSDVPNEYYAAADSLFGRIPAKNIDSVAIASCYDDAPENEFLILRYVEDKAAPVVGEILPDKNDPTESNFELYLDNIGADSAALILGYDSRYIEGEVREIVLSGFGSAVVPFQVTSEVSDSMELMIVIQDREDRYYPHLVRAFYPLQNPTDAAEGDAVVPDLFDLKIYPNPGRDNFKISGTGLRRATKAEVCNILGQRVAEISLYPDRDAVWDGRNAGGESMPSGIYFIRIFEARSGWLTRRLVLMR
jgi:hypothetical protein